MNTSSHPKQVAPRLPYAPLTTETLFHRQDEVSRRIGTAIALGWHRKPQFYEDLDADAAERKLWGAAIDARFPLAKAVSA